jgi:[ribosomal protein S18]-alanine N-acetyltransferase
MASHEPAPVYMVRRFEASDTNAIEAIAKKSPEAAQWSRESYAKLGEHGRQAWVAGASDKPLGFLIARAIEREVEILNLAVEPAHRRRGVAKALLDAAFAEFRRAEIHRVFLEVRESNRPAIAFYGSAGFVTTGRREAYYREPPEAAVLMMKKLAV